jgi:hypothetical protein
MRRESSQRYLYVIHPQLNKSTQLNWVKQTGEWRGGEGRARRSVKTIQGWMPPRTLF